MIAETNQFSLSVSRPELEKRRLVVRVSKPRESSLVPKVTWASVSMTGFEAESISQAESYAMAILEACVVARQLNTNFKTELLEDKPACICPTVTDSHYTSCPRYGWQPNQHNKPEV